MKITIKVISSIIVLFVLPAITATNLFAQDPLYESYNDIYDSPKNSPTDWSLPSEQSSFPMRDDPFEELSQQNSDWLQLIIGPSSNTPPGSGTSRPGNDGAQDGIGHIPIGDGTITLIVIISFYVITVFIRKKLRIKGFV